MKAYKSYLLLLFCLIFSKEAFSQYTEVINSNRPGVSRSAFSVGTDVVQFEVGPYIIKEKRTPAASYEVEGFGVDFFHLERGNTATLFTSGQYCTCTC